MERFAAWFRAFQGAQKALVEQTIVQQRVLRALQQRHVQVQADAPPHELAAIQYQLHQTRRVADEARRVLLGQIEALKHLGPQSSRGDDPFQVFREVLAVSSVVYRLDLESLAMLPTVNSHAFEATLDYRADQPVRAGLARIVAELPPYAEAVQDRFERQLELSAALTDALSVRAGTDLDETAGFALRESVVDQVVGISWDSLQAHAKFSTEVFFFHETGGEDPSASASQGEDSPSFTENYTGRTRRLRYDLEPIVLLGGRVGLSFDWIKLPNALTLNGSFGTDRIYASGGEAEYSTSLGEQLGLEGAVSDVFDIGVGLLGIQTLVKKAHFSSGQVELVAVDPTTGRDIGVIDTAPLQLEYTQVDVGYDFAFLLPQFGGSQWLEELQLGFRYMNYRLPRILYEMADTDPLPDQRHYAFVRQSPPQTLDSRYYMGGLVGRVGRGARGLLSPYLDLGLYLGSGPMEYYFLREGGSRDAPVNREYFSANVFVLNFTANLGLRVRVTPARSRFRFLVDTRYHLDLVKQTIPTQGAETATSGGQTVETVLGKKVDFGTTDVMHGPRLYLVATF